MREVGEAVSFNENLEGESLFGSIDADKGVLSFSPQTSDYAAKVYAVFITCHVETDPTV